MWKEHLIFLIRFVLFVIFCASVVEAQNKQIKLSGHVTDEKGIPLSGVEIGIIGRAETTFTENNGNFFIPLHKEVLQNELKITAKKDGYEHFERTYPLSQIIEIQLKPLIKNDRRSDLFEHNKRSVLINLPVEKYGEILGDFDIREFSYKIAFQKLLEIMIKKEIHIKMKRICIIEIDVNKLESEEKQNLKIHLLLLHKILNESGYFEFFDRREISRWIVINKTEDMGFSYSHKDLEKITKKAKIDGYLYLTIAHYRNFTTMHIQLKSRLFETVLGVSVFVQQPYLEDFLLLSQ